eukprot:TRINITY_DN2523_c0_g1_i11.p1 TRINITY_DN2523_c0_g1~~TRINITY_DN2523_c0_g1_i11.p1  ORF type:complete len:114 (+),score=20.54 TRINITY_DN2523_c0_g1_i11:79-420(+)
MNLPTLLELNYRFLATHLLAKESGEIQQRRKKSRSVSREREKEGETEEEREKKRARGKEWERGGKFPRDTAEDCCFNCGEPGHHQVECPKPGRTFDCKNCYLWKEGTHLKVLP